MREVFIRGITIQFTGTGIMCPKGIKLRVQDCKILLPKDKSGRGILRATLRETKP